MGSLGTPLGILCDKKTHMYKCSFIQSPMDTGSPPLYRSRPTSFHPHTIPPDPFPRMLYTNYQAPPKTTFAANLKLRTNSSSNSHISTFLNAPNSTLTPAALKVSTQSLFNSTAEEGHGDLAKSLPFSFCFISVCLSNAHPWAKQCFRLCRSVTPSISVCFLPFSFFLIILHCLCYLDDKKILTKRLLHTK